MSLNTYAYASAQDLLEAIPFYDALDCDLVTITNAFIRHTRENQALSGFKVKGLPFPASNFSGVHLILTPLVRVENERRTLAPVAAFIVAHDITHMRIVGEGNWNRQHQYSRNGGRSWGRMPVQGKAPPQPAPTQVVEPEIPPPPVAATEDDLPLWEN